jgi:hypothetical protein
MMKNNLTRLRFVARPAWATGAGLQGWVQTLAGGGSGPRRAALASPPLPTPPGDAEPMTHLGLLHLKGRGSTRDYAQARHWFQKAAAAGSATAMYNLGVMHEHGHGVPQDHAQACNWYRRAAEAGHAPAAERLSRLQERSCKGPAFCDRCGPPVNCA